MNKTKFMLGSCTSNIQVKIQINGIDLERVSETDFLG